MLGVRYQAAVAVVWAATLVAAVPLASRHEVGLDEEVRQLLDLKGQVAQRDLHQLKTHATQDNQTHASTSLGNDRLGGGMRQGKVDSTREEAFHLVDGALSRQVHAEERVLANGVPVSRLSSDVEESKEAGHAPHSRTQVQLDVPSENLHETLTDEDGHRSLFREAPKTSGVRYSPLDLALYIYKTGDEERITLAIQELIAEGLMTAEEALSYLHSIREHLRYLTQQDADDKMESQPDLAAVVKKNSLPLSLTEMNLGDPEGMLAPEPDYEGLMERLRGQDDQYTQYSLEEVIYQLAKIIFKQAMHRGGDEGSERALQEVAALLEKEVARGAISPQVEKKLLDVMVNSLVDSLGESELPAAPGPVIGGSSFRLSSEGSFPMRTSSVMGGSAMKPISSLFQASKGTTKREAPADKSVASQKAE
ncbi:uncharacterized protein LOC123513146 isoform X2 [Portunus trituberculatus]|uniref:uncharacterized protein LOC123513146 isoform X2 n=1 Tax=Portunus trituberculatus TaxID=210409 RepID=UPI001E1CEE9E|nr:uncharacterized protein LOC123513146 isoform X2 [Portunus trituberculatus]